MKVYNFVTMALLGFLFFGCAISQDIESLPDDPTTYTVEIVTLDGMD